MVWLARPNGTGTATTQRTLATLATATRSSGTVVGGDWRKASMEERRNMSKVPTMAVIYVAGQRGGKIAPQSGVVCSYARRSSAAYGSIVVFTRP